MNGLSLMSVGPMVNTKEATAEVGDVLNGKTFFAGDYHIKTGTMPNKGAWNDSVAMNGSVTIPAGYHNGSGKVVSTSVSVSSSGGSNSVWTYNDSTTVTVGASFSGSPKKCYAYLSSVTGVRFYDNSIENISIGSPWISGNTAYVNVTGNKNISGVAQMWGANVTFIFIYY